MTPRERVLAALRHEEPDRVPFDLGSTTCTGIHRVAYANLRAALGLPTVEPQIMHQSLQLAWVGEDVHRALETDLRGVRPSAPSGWRLHVTEDERFQYYTDDWGVERRMPRDNGYYFDLWRCPLADAQTPADIERHPFLPAADPARFVGLRERAAAVRAQGFPVVLAGGTGGMLEASQWMRGYEAVYCDLAADKRMAEALFDRILAFKLEFWSHALKAAGDLTDVVMEGDDYGGQSRMLLSARTWRELLKPRLATLFAHIKRCAPHVRILLHSCGSVREIIPDLIEVGLDALNPIQVAAAGMDTRELKRDFGRQLAFWGGGVDTQRVLPFGTPGQVRDEVWRRVADLAPGGGFIFAAVHNIQADVPPANILAMREAALEGWRAR